MSKTNVKRIDVPLPGLVGAERREGERSEPAAASADGGAVPVREAEGPKPARPDPEVVAKAARRHFNAEYKQRVLHEVDLCRDEGAIGALLRREGLYSSHLTTWRRQRDQAVQAALAPHKRGAQAGAEPIGGGDGEAAAGERSVDATTGKGRDYHRRSKKSFIPAGDSAEGQQQRWEQLVHVVEQIAPAVGRAAACRALEVPRCWLYRQIQEATESVVREARPSPARALEESERRAVLELLHSDRFVDRSPSEMYATLLDEGTYLCSIRTMYRILEENGEVRERRDQLRHPQYQKPELLATGPNQVWSWDITKLLGPVKWTYFYLYVILDIFSRYVVGWMVAPGESAELAKRLIGETSRKQNITPEQLTIHADRGTSMTSKPVALLLADLGITKTHSRPHVSDDNPYSESESKRLNDRRQFPERLGWIEDSREFCQEFMRWYNTEHHHTGIGLLTPETVHYGRAEAVIEERQRVLSAAYEQRPERFVRQAPRAPELQEAVWINPPVKTAAAKGGEPV